MVLTTEGMQNLCHLPFVGSLLYIYRDLERRLLDLASKLLHDLSGYA